MKDNKCPDIWFIPDGPFTGGKRQETAYGPDGRLPAIGLGGVVMCLSTV